MRISDDFKKRLVEKVKRDIKNICCIYPTVGNAMYEEPLERMIGRIAVTVESMLLDQHGFGEIYAHKGLLWRFGEGGSETIPLPEADEVARKAGFACAEQMVRHLEKEG
jgi:hypothetical protein